MCPYFILITRISFGITCKNHIYMIHLSVAVPVILMPVGRHILHLINSLDHHFTNMSISSILIGTIISLLLADRNRSEYIKIKQKLPTALISEIVGHGTDKGSFMKILSAKDLLIEGVVMPLLKSIVGKVHQDDNAFMLVGRAGTNTLAARTR